MPLLRTLLASLSGVGGGSCVAVFLFQRVIQFTKQHQCIRYGYSSQLLSEGPALEGEDISVPEGILAPREKRNGGGGEEYRCTIQGLSKLCDPEREGERCTDRKGRLDSSDAASGSIEPSIQAIHPHWTLQRLEEERGSIEPSIQLLQYIWHLFWLLWAPSVSLWTWKLSGTHRTLYVNSWQLSASHNLATAASLSPNCIMGWLQSSLISGHRRTQREALSRAVNGCSVDMAAAALALPLI